jgi:hypothetical protein
MTIHQIILPRTITDINSNPDLRPSLFVASPNLDHSIHSPTGSVGWSSSSRDKGEPPCPVLANGVAPGLPARLPIQLRTQFDLRSSCHHGGGLAVFSQRIPTPPLSETWTVARPEVLPCNLEQQSTMASQFIGLHFLVTVRDGTQLKGTISDITVTDHPSGQRGIVLSNGMALDPC